MVILIGCNTWLSWTRIQYFSNLVFRYLMASIWSFSCSTHLHIKPPQPFISSWNEISKHRFHLNEPTSPLANHNYLLDSKQSKAVDSQVHHAEISHALLSCASSGWRRRLHGFKNKSPKLSLRVRLNATRLSSSSAGAFTFPLHQVASSTPQTSQPLNQHMLQSNKGLLKKKDF
jgi:hypothetical protein